MSDQIQIIDRTHDSFGQPVQGRVKGRKIENGHCKKPTGRSTPSSSGILEQLIVQRFFATGESSLMLQEVQATIFETDAPERVPTEFALEQQQPRHQHAEPKPNAHLHHCVPPKGDSGPTDGYGEEHR